MWIAVELTYDPDDLSFDDVYTGENKQLLFEKLQKAGYSVSIDQIEEGREIDLECSSVPLSSWGRRKFIKIMKEHTPLSTNYPLVERDDGYWVQPE